MDFLYAQDNQQMQRSLRQFMDRHVLPANRASRMNPTEALRYE